MLRLKLVFFLFSVLLFFHSVRAIDHEFSQFYASPIYLNPAFAGSVECPRITLSSRYQWPGQLGDYVTNTVSYDQFSNKLSGGVSVIASNDWAGDYSLVNNNFSLIYSYQVNITRQFSLKMGAQATIGQIAIDPSKLTFGDQIDVAQGFIYNTGEVFQRTQVLYPDFSAGILGFNKNYFASVAVHHLTEPTVTFSDDQNNSLLRKYTFSAGALFPLGSTNRSKKNYTDTKLSPNILVRLQNGNTHVNVGMYLMKNKIIGGIWYRFGDAIIALVGVQLDKFKIGYSYDITVSSLTPASFGSHELSLGIKLPCRVRPVKFKAQPCPEF